MPNTIVGVETGSEGQTTSTETPMKQSRPDGPAALPAHILAVGEHHQLAGSAWWIGHARPAYKEVSHLLGVVIYNRTTHIFLTLKEAAEAQMLLSRLIHQEIGQPGLVETQVQYPAGIVKEGR